MRRLMFGSDPELFITNGKEIVAAHRVGVPYVRDKIKVAEGAYFRDGWALEVNPNPSTTSKGLYNNIRAVLSAAKKALPTELSFSSVPCTLIDLKLLDKAPSDVKEFGCNPSYDAWHRCHYYRS